jgi:leader peptidase (prepilin peptidase)/N-methyltransferase
MTVLSAGGVGLLVGGSIGFGIRILLAGLRRGTVLPAGPIELAAALVAAVGAAIGWGTPLLATVLWIGLYAVAAGFVDIRHHRLPDALTLSAVPITAVVLLVTEWVAPATGSPIRSALTAVGVGALFAAPALLSPVAMGWGDVKLMVSLGAATGFVSVAAALLAVVVGFVLAAVVALAGILFGRWTTKSAIPLGPFLLLGSWLVLLWASVR